MIRQRRPHDDGSTDDRRETQEHVTEIRQEMRGVDDLISYFYKVSVPQEGETECAILQHRGQ